MTTESTLAGVGIILTGLGGLGALIESVRRITIHNGRANEETFRATTEILSNLNHLDEPVGQHPSIGQMIGRTDARVDRIETKIDALHGDVRSLSNAMLAHITDEGRRTQRLEEQVRELDRRKWEATNGQGVTD
jgi:archaellum component FlaC